MPSSTQTPEISSPFVFDFGPFRFESEIDIPKLRTTRGSGERSVTIRLGDVPTRSTMPNPMAAFAQVAALPNTSSTSPALLALRPQW